MEEQKTYYTPHGIITKLDTFKGKKALVGDYTPFSYFNTKMVLESLGIEYEIVSTADEVLNKIQTNNYDVIFTNNIYKYGDDRRCVITKTKIYKRFQYPHSYTYYF